MLAFLAKPIVSYIAVPVAIGASLTAIWLAWENRGLERDLAVERAATATVRADFIAYQNAILGDVARANARALAAEREQARTAADLEARDAELSAERAMRAAARTEGLRNASEEDISRLGPATLHWLDLLRNDQAGAAATGD